MVDLYILHCNYYSSIICKRCYYSTFPLIVNLLPTVLLENCVEEIVTLVPTVEIVSCRVNRMYDTKQYRLVR
jgi:hypothetical protein